MPGKATGGAGEINPTPTPIRAYPRMKFVWRAFLISNIAITAFLFAKPRIKTKSVGEESSKDAKVQEEPKESAVFPPTQEPIPQDSTPGIIPRDQQRELLKWMLEEKRNVIPRDTKEEQLMNEEKATLEQFIREESFPDI